MKVWSDKEFMEIIVYNPFKFIRRLSKSFIEMFYTPNTTTDEVDENEVYRNYQASVDKKRNSPNFIIKNKVHKIIDTFNSSKMSMLENIIIRRDNIKVKYVNKKSKYCGTFSPGLMTITIYKNGMSDEVIIHEVAHYVDFCIRGCSPHDTFYDSINRACGGSCGRYLDMHGV